MGIIKVHRVIITAFIILIFNNLAIDATSGGSDLTPYLQPNDIIYGSYDNFPKNNSNLCTRKCNGKPKICYYRFVVEFYDTMNPACGNCPNVTEDCLQPQCIPADGYERPMISINRMYPGPAIYVCVGDRVIVDLNNRLIDKAITIHWHGIRQLRTPFMDGVPMVTQCPIFGGQTFRYDFRVDKAGSFFYHSHDSLQKVDGLQGPLIVREIEGKDFQRNQYTYDLPSHIVFTSDWLPTLADTRLPGTIRKDVGQRASNFLINGRGIVLNKPPKTKRGLTPMAEFRVKKGGKYRFRFIGATCLDCAVELSIQSHRMSLITTDGGNPVNPTDVSSLSLLAGDRFDVVVDANQQIGTYWIYLQGLGECYQYSQYAVLRYDNSEDELPPNELNVVNGPIKKLNFPYGFCNSSSPESLCINQIQGSIKPPLKMTKNREKRNLRFQFGFYKYNKNELYQPNTYKKYFIPAIDNNSSDQPELLKATINNISFNFPSSPILYQIHDIPKEEFCPKKCKEGYGDISSCDCFNHYKVPTGCTVNIIITDSRRYDPSGLTHPFHLHGYDFYVHKMGILEGDYEASVNNIMDNLNTNGINGSPPRKDTIVIPPGGYALISLYTDNPGYWLFHCHFLIHLELGMAGVFQVGERKEMVHPPRRFPRCYNYVPDVYLRSSSSDG